MDIIQEAKTKGISVILENGMKTGIQDFLERYKGDIEKLINKDSVPKIIINKLHPGEKVLLKEGIYKIQKRKVQKKWEKKLIIEKRREK